MIWLLLFFVILLCVDYAVIRNAENISIARISYAIKKDLSQINADHFKNNEEKQEDFFSTDKNEEEDWDEFDDLIDKEEFNFLLLGVIATVLFLLFGFFTGNAMYFYLMIFIISAGVYLNGRVS